MSKSLDYVPCSSLVAEIKDKSDRKQKEHLLHSIAVETKAAFTPNVEFSYNVRVHDV